jgi:hypothetical protein
MFLYSKQGNFVFFLMNIFSVPGATGVRFVVADTNSEWCFYTFLFVCYQFIFQTQRLYIYIIMRRCFFKLLEVCFWMSLESFLALFVIKLYYCLVA